MGRHALSEKVVQIKRMPSTLNCGLSGREVRKSKRKEEIGDGMDFRLSGR
jgi:hypothetical protein